MSKFIFSSQCLLATALYHSVLPYRGLTADSLVQSATASIMMRVVLVEVQVKEDHLVRRRAYCSIGRNRTSFFLLCNLPEDLNSFKVTRYQSTSTTMKTPKKYLEYHAAEAWSKIKWFLSKPDLIGR